VVDLFVAAERMEGAMVDKYSRVVTRGPGIVICVLLTVTVIGSPVVMYFTGKKVQEKFLDRQPGNHAGPVAPGSGRRYDTTGVL